MSPPPQTQEQAAAVLPVSPCGDDSRSRPVFAGPPPKDVAPRRSRRQDRERPRQDEERVGSGGSSGSGGGSGGSGGGGGSSGGGGGSGGSTNSGAAFNMLAMLAAAQQGAVDDDEPAVVEIELPQLQHPHANARTGARRASSSGAGGPHSHLRHQDSEAHVPGSPAQLPARDSPRLPPQQAHEPARDQPVGISASPSPAAIPLSASASSKRHSQARPPQAERAFAAAKGSGTPEADARNSPRSSLAGDPPRGSAFNLRAMLDAARLDKDAPEDPV